jgi:hypothetical protein
MHICFFFPSTGGRGLRGGGSHTISLSKDNATARRRLPGIRDCVAIILVV